MTGAAPSIMEPSLQQLRLPRWQVQLAVAVSLLLHLGLLLLGNSQRPASRPAQAALVAHLQLPPAAQPPVAAPQTLTRLTSPRPSPHKIPPVMTPPTLAPTPPQTSSTQEVNEASASEQHKLGEWIAAPDWLAGLDSVYYLAQDLDQHAAPLAEITPEFPPELEQKIAGGVVRLLVLINEWGGVDDAYVIAAEPAFVLDEAALVQFRAARFTPAQKDGRYVKSQKQIEVRFGDAMQEAPATAPPALTSPVSPLPRGLR